MPYLYPYLLCTSSISLSIDKEENIMFFAHFWKIKSQDCFSRVNNAKNLHKRDIEVSTK